MEGVEKEIREYITKAGKNPFREWLFSLCDASVRFKIRERLDRARLGNLGDHRSVGQGVLELRLAMGPGYRVYFGQSGMKLIILLCGGDKSSQTSDIRKAQEFWLDYRRRWYESK